MSPRIVDHSFSDVQCLFALNPILSNPHLFQRIQRVDSMFIPRRLHISDVPSSKFLLQVLVSPISVDPSSTLFHPIPTRFHLDSSSSVSSVSSSSSTSSAAAAGVFKSNNKSLSLFLVEAIFCFGLLWFN